jgi:hypothetical protein
VMSHWVALCSPLSDFSFQHFSFSAFAEMWLWVAPGWPQPGFVVH